MAIFTYFFFSLMLNLFITLSKGSLTQAAAASAAIEMIRSNSSRSAFGTGDNTQSGTFA